MTRQPARTGPARPVVHYQPMPDQHTPADLVGYQRYTAQIAARQEQDRVLYLRWKQRQAAIAERDRRTRTFLLALAATVGVGILAALTAALWLLWHAITGIDWIIALPLALVLLGVLGARGHRCITVVQHWALTPEVPPTMTTTTTATTTRTRSRRALTDGLRNLATFLDRHPDAPADSWQEIHYIVSAAADAAGLAALAAIAHAIGVEVTATGDRPVTPDTTHFHATRTFGPITYKASYILRQEMADYRALMSYSGTIRAETA